MAGQQSGNPALKNKAFQEVAAAVQGLILGVISFFANLEFPGIVLQAVLITAAIFFGNAVAIWHGLN